MAEANGFRGLGVVVGLLLCGLSAALAAAAQPSKVGNFGSPQATFDTARQALTRGRYNDFVHCFNDDGLKELAAYVHATARSMAEVTSSQTGSPSETTSSCSRPRAFLNATAVAFDPATVL